MTFKYRYRKQIIISLIFLILIGFLSFGVYKFNSRNKKNNKKGIKEEIVVTKTQKIERLSSNKDLEKNKEEKEKEKIMVDIKGNVVKPGIYELDIGKRIIDAINSAGGLTESADTSVLNLSKKLKDEMVIIVYSYEEVANFTLVKEQEQIRQEECIKGINDINNDACIEEENIAVNSDLKVSINNATIEELMSLDGVGESKAKAIIEYREKNGNFENIDDLLKVNGIGDSLLAKIKENITL